MPSSTPRSDPATGPLSENAIRGGAKNYIYLQRGDYVLDNPIVIDRATPLFIHGIDRMQTRLVAFDTTKPLFVVKNAPLINFAGIRIQPTVRTPSALHSKALSMANIQPATIEILDCFVDHTTLEFNGPGSYRIQGSALTPGGKVRTAVLVDHPDADVLIWGGDITNGTDRLVVDDHAHVWQKRGHVRIYSTTVEGALGPADVRIESGASLGPHVIANVRSEGANGALDKTGAPSRLLYVPPTADRVDVVLQNDGGAWLTGPTSDPRNCKLAWYNGAGTLWLLGNRSEYCAKNIVEGNAPAATIVSIGNQIASPQPFSGSFGAVISAVDQFSHFNYTGGSQESPWTRWIPDGSMPRRLSTYPSVPIPPSQMVPTAITRPVMTAALPGMINVKAAPYLAKGNGTADDTRAIQAALDANCGVIPKAIYFPAGTYRITDTLYLHHHSGGTCRKSVGGGWIAGAGSASTILAMAANVKKGVFATDGLAYATVQGITFKTWAWQSGDPQRPNVDLEMYSGYQATQQNNFHDTVFDGGFIGLANGVKFPSGGQCSSNAVFGGTFKNASFGLASGHYNALANGAYDSQFIDNDYAMGAWSADEARMPAGGSFLAYRSTSRGSRIADFLFRGTATGTTWYFYGWDSDAPAYFPHRVGRRGASADVRAREARSAARRRLPVRLGDFPGTDLPLLRAHARRNPGRQLGVVAELCGEDPVADPGLVDRRGAGSERSARRAPEPARLAGVARHAAPGQLRLTRAPARIDSLARSVARETATSSSSANGDAAPLRTASTTSLTASAWPLSWLRLVRFSPPGRRVLRKLSHEAVRPSAETSKRSLGRSELAFAR
jgi:hypothetical protein